MEGANLSLARHWGEGKVPVMCAKAAELVREKPDVIAVSTASALREVQRVAGKTPVVFWDVSDPVGNKFVQSEARPGANITGFSLYSYEMAGKWLQLLKEAAPRTKRVLVVMNSANPNLPGWLRATDAAAGSLGVAAVRVQMNDMAEVENAINSFAREPAGGLLVLPDPFLTAHADRIVRLAEQHRLPAIYGSADFVAKGGLLGYSVDRSDLPKRAAGYVSRILKGESPDNLPVQAPSKFEFTLNAKAAKAIGVRFPQAMMLRADKVIE